MGEEELNQLYLKHKGRVYNLVLYYVKDPYLSEDIAHEVLLKCYFNREKFSGHCSINTWMNRVTVNHCIDYLRSSHMKKITPSENIDSLLNQQLTLEDTVVIYIDNENLRKQIDLLPSIYVEVLNLYYFKNYSIKEIHSVLKLNVSTVKTRLYRAKKTLRKMYDNDEEFSTLISSR
ncbi:sigma-70 family RNA polymerase sigma factor [Aquibacillus halophilus]|uniref:Sigma-70 family RNA polymerase sigma factor n=1 Tax=Aquibacillus halophilus TaxID=930132 RepID=A0A6A8DE12_9BACI|nr:sigma-70 family RNA polymerase sigma factor [Aquibacillus halophilus]MRH42079.1 sigma-70 family RNA polymerase sigma factor [Aquibacillus halophilus]